MLLPCGCCCAVWRKKTETKIEKCSHAMMASNSFAQLCSKFCSNLRIEQLGTVELLMLKLSCVDIILEVESRWMSK